MLRVPANLRRNWQELSTGIAMVACTATTMTVLPACSVSGTPTATPSAAAESVSALQIRQTDDAGRPLPFKTEFPNRWNSNNSGTSYEPCTQVPGAVVQRFDLDEASVNDVAGSDFQTARGCQWKFSENRHSFLSQFVGNLDRPDGGLTAHKEDYSTTTWHPDTEIAGRRVIVGSIDPGDCAAYVQSGNAVVVTNVVLIELEPQPMAACNAAVDFLRATIGAIPR
ncbi:DUF3558 family protein [Gordonia paraffinivorans]|nr:DUF3558 family protein [Gordonia paraffinivorans]